MHGANLLACHLDTTNRSIVPTPTGKPFFCPFGYLYGPTSRMMASDMRMRDIAMFFGLIAKRHHGGRRSYRAR